MDTRYWRGLASACSYPLQRRAFNLSYENEAGGCIDQPEDIYAQIFLEMRPNSGAHGVYNSKSVSVNSRVRVGLDNNRPVTR